MTLNHNFRIGLLLFAGLVPCATAQTKASTEGAALVEVRDGTGCVSLFAGMNTGDLKTHIRGRGRHKTKTFEFRGVQVSTFPEPIRVEIAVFSQCENAGMSSSFAWPDFSKQFRFAFHWGINDGDSQAETRNTQPLQSGEMNSVWKEGSSSKEFWFTIPTADVPVTAKLSIDVLSGEKLLKTFVLKLR